VFQFYKAENHISKNLQSASWRIDAKSVWKQSEL